MNYELRITNYIKIISVLIVTLVCCRTYAQRRDYNFRFTAVIMDADTTLALPNCHIINKTQNIGTISDRFGIFTVTANVGDSIMISYIGYETLTIAIRDSMYTNNRTIKLQPAIYTLTELDVGILSTYDRFKRDILSREAAEAYRLAATLGKWDIYTTPLPNQGGINVPVIGALESPVTFFYNLMSQEGKQIRYYHSVINGTAEYIIIGEKFNGFIVKQITGFENDELVKFMSYCKFTKEYLLVASGMQIQREIMFKYRKYVDELKIEN